MRTFRSVFFLLLGTILVAAIGWRPTLPQAGAAQAFDVIAEAEDDGLSLLIRIPDFSLETVDAAGSAYERFAFEGQNGSLERPGAPELPVINLVFAAPPEGEISLESVQSAGRLLDGSFTPLPAPSPAALAEDLTPGQTERIPEPAVYGSDLSYPAAVAEISGEAWLRGQRLVRLTVSPFQFHPATGEVTFHPEFDLRVRFSETESASSCSDCAFDPELEAVLQEQLINYEQARGWRLAAGSEAFRELIESPQANPFLGPRIEIVVDEDGIYRLTYTDLQQAGMEVDFVDPQTFRLVNQGQEAAIYVEGESDGSFDPEDFVVFYGQKFRGELMEARYQDTMTKPNNQFNDPAFAANNWFWQCRSGCDLASYFERYTDENVYYLLEGGTPGPRMASVDGTPAGAPIPDHYFATVRAEEQNEWWSHEFHDDEVWFWKRVRSFSASQNPTTYTVSLDSLAAGVFTATVHLEVSSRSQDVFNSPDHHTRFELNDQLIDDRYWDGRQRLAITTDIPQDALLEGTNTLTMTLFNDVVLVAPYMYFDFYEITYARSFQAVNDRLAFSYDQPGTWHFQVGGFSSQDVEVYDLTDPVHPARILNPAVSGGPGNYTAGFETAVGSLIDFLAVGTGGGVLSPKKIAAYNPPDFENLAPAEMVLITHADFMTSTQVLADYRAAQGHSVALIDVSDLYQEFNDGIYHPIAIKNFLAYAFANWQSPPEYVTLVGSGNFNMKNFGDGTQGYHNAPPSLMPPNLAYADPWQGEVDSANLLATLVGDDTVPDLHIGRIPVASDDEMAVVVGKIISYETAPPASWQKNILFIADSIPDSAGNFELFAEDIITEYIDPHPYFEPQRIYLDDGDDIPNGYDYGCNNVAPHPFPPPSPNLNCEAVTDAIVSTINLTGTLVVNYIGHASYPSWTGELVFVTNDVPQLTNADQLPIVLSMTCLDGFWTFPNADSLAYTFLTSTGKGAVATFSPTGLGISTGHDYLHRGFYDSLLADGSWEIGPATLSGKLLLWGTGFNYDLMHTFTIFGDPALGIKNPYQFALTPDSSAQSGDAGTDVMYSLTVQNTGADMDTFDIQLTPGGWPAVASGATVGPLAPGQSAPVQVTVSIPPGALDGQTDVALLSVTSRGDVQKTAVSLLTTSAETDGLAVTPSVQTKFGDSGTDLQYSLSVTNTTILTDTFSLQVSGADWPFTAPATVGPLGPGQGMSIQVTISIPLSALPGENDLLSLLFTSQNTPANTAAASLQAVVSGGQIYLPLISR